MTQTSVMVLVAIGTFAASVGGSLFVAGAVWGGMRARLDLLESQVPGLATRDQLASVKEDLAEIKGMFRMVPHESPGHSGRTGGGAR